MICSVETPRASGKAEGFMGGKRHGQFIHYTLMWDNLVNTPQWLYAGGQCPNP